jgi:hypothetical protein
MKKRAKLFAWLVVLVAVAGFGWVAGLIVLAVTIPRAISYLLRLRLALAPETKCPRGHSLEQYGTYRCSCGRVRDAWVWQCPSPLCRRAAGWVRCPVCGIAVDNPMLVH